MLSDTAVRQAKAAGSPRKLTDGRGLYLFIATSGAKTWRFDYRYLGKRQTLTIGPYPEVGVKEARARHADAREQLERGTNPAAQKQIEKRSKLAAAENTFEAVANRWLQEMIPHRKRSWGVLISGWFRNHIFPVFGSKPLDDITPADVLMLVRGVADSGIPRTAENCRWIISRVYSYAIRNLMTKFNPAREIRGAIALPPTRHHKTLSAKELPAFLRKIDAYDGKPETRIALRLLVLTFVRKTELVNARWSEIDFDARRWVIPGERMKMGLAHVVPLSSQALACLRELEPLTGRFEHVFPRFGDPKRAMSDETILAAFDRMGYRGRFSPHGVRGTASTLLNEQGYRPDVIERQLAHVEPNRTRRSYNHAEYLPEREAMMQAWADYLDGLKSGAAVVGIRRSGSR